MTYRLPVLPEREDEITARLARLRKERPRLVAEADAPLVAIRKALAGRYGDDPQAWPEEQVQAAAKARRDSVRPLLDADLEISVLSRQLTAIRSPAPTADEIKAARADGTAIEPDLIREALEAWQARADDLAARAAKRTRQGKSPLASEADATEKARRNAYALSQLLDDMEPVHRLTADERFPRHDHD